MIWSQAQRFTESLAATSCSVVITDATLPGNPIVYVNEAFSALSGYRPAEVVGRNCRLLQGKDSDPLVRAEIRAAIADGGSIRRDVLNYRKDGTPFWNDVAIDPIRDKTGRLTGFIGIQRQCDPIHLAISEKDEAESRLARIADHMPGYIYERVMRTDGSIEISYISPSLRKLLGVAETEPSSGLYNYVHPDDRPALLAAVRNSAETMSIFREEFRLISSDGSVHWLRSDAPPRRAANGEIIWDGLAIEIAAEARWESEIASHALRDPLTGLLTRAAWRRALEIQLGTSADRAQPCGVVCVDIAGFRDLNDRVGQSAADEILSETAQRLAGIAASAGGVAARLGGDEFTALLPACPSEERLAALAAAIGEALSRPIQIGGQTLAIRTCIGAVLYEHAEGGEPEGKHFATELMTQAELALRWAKQAGFNAHVLYSPELDDRFSNQTVLAQSLERAIAGDELDLHYQPLVDLASGRIVSAEALVRWNHPTLGTQRPDIFIPLAEKMGLIGSLGRWVLDRAVRQRGEWVAAGLSPPSISINISGNQLLEPGFVADVQALFAAGDAVASDFELELTEGLLIEPSPQVMAALHALRGMGFTIAIDDFGSGHATFRYLRDFPIDKLKIDQMFVRKLVVDSTDALIIRAVISLARGMGVAFVAEGIETEMQREFLEREGCRIGQGYLFSMPLVAEDFGWMLANDVRLPLRASGEWPGEGRHPDKKTEMKVSQT